MQLAKSYIVVFYKDMCVCVCVCVSVCVCVLSAVGKILYCSIFKGVYVCVCVFVLSAVYRKVQL